MGAETEGGRALDHKERRRDRAIASKLRGRDIAKLEVGDLVRGGRVRSRAIAVRQKTGRPGQFGLLDPAQASLEVSGFSIGLSGRSPLPSPKAAPVRAPTLPGQLHHILGRDPLQ